MIIKTEKERQALVEGGKRLADILKVLSTMVAPGISTQALEDEARQLIEEGVDKPAFLGYTPHGAKKAYPAALCVSINEEIVHGIPNGDRARIIQDGDIVSLDCGLVHDGLITDACVTVIAGTARHEDVRLVRAVYEALDAAVGAVRAGSTIGDIGQAVDDVRKKYGYGSPPELGGHGVGREVHESPFIPHYGPAGSGEKLVEGQVLALEPMFTAGSHKIKLHKDGYTYSTSDSSRTAQAEHTVIVEKGGASVVTI